MFALLCSHCEKGVAFDEDVYVINKRAYCSDCFTSFVTVEARMKAREYANSWGATTKVIDKE